MICIKCGRKISGEQVFCGECQEDMEYYPVKPGTPIQLPVYNPAPETKQKPPRSRKALTPEARLSRQRKTIRLLTVALAAALAAFVLMSCLALYLLDQRDRQSSIGQNYHVIAE